MNCPAFFEALRDAEIRGAPKELFFWLQSELVYTEYRPLKLWPLAHAMKMNKAVVSRAMKRLIERGYVKEGPRERPGGKTYALVPARKR